jgi:uncharacterized membrane protein (UPF0127 family)
MMILYAKNESKGQVLAQRVKAAVSLWSRSKGLLGTASLPSDEGLWLKPCRSVHTLFMRYPIDVLFLSREGLVLSKATLPPWRMSSWERQADGVLELAAGTIQRTQTNVGDRVSLKEI